MLFSFKFSQFLFGRSLLVSIVFYKVSCGNQSQQLPTQTMEDLQFLSWTDIFNKIIHGAKSEYGDLFFFLFILHHTGYIFVQVQFRLSDFWTSMYVMKKQKSNFIKKIQTERMEKKKKTHTHQAAGHRQQCRRAFWAGTGWTCAVPHRGHLWSQTHPVSGSGTLHWLSCSLPPRPGCAASESLRAYSCPDPTASDYSLCRETEETKFHWMFEFTASINYNCQYKHCTLSDLGAAVARQQQEMPQHWWQTVWGQHHPPELHSGLKMRKVKNIWLTKILKVTNKTLEPF